MIKRDYSSPLYGNQSSCLVPGFFRQIKSMSLTTLLIGGLATMPGKALADEFENVGFSNLWQGFYMGGDLGLAGAGGTVKKGAGQKDFDFSQGIISPGLHLGYNFASSLHNGSGWMLGTEIDLAYTGFNDRKNDPLLGNVSLDGSFLATTRLRAGYVFDRLFVYGAVGLAFTDMNMRPVGTKGYTVSAGPSLGLGAEYKFTDDWSMRVEAQNHFLPNLSYSFSGTTRKVKRGMGSISVGFSRKF